MEVNNAGGSKVRIMKFKLPNNPEFGNDGGPFQVKRAKSSHTEKLVRSKFDQNKLNPNDHGAQNNNQSVEVEEDNFTAKKESTKLRKNSVGDQLNKRINIESALHIRKKEMTDNNNSQDTPTQPSFKKPRLAIQEYTFSPCNHADENIGDDDMELSNLGNLKESLKLDFLKHDKRKTENKIGRKSSISEILSNRSRIGIITPRSILIAGRDGDKDAIPSVVEEKIYTGAELLYHTNDGNVTKVLHILSEAPHLLNYKSEDGRMIVHICSSLGHFHLLREVMSRYSIDVNILMNNGLTALMLAAAQGHIEIIDLLLKSGAKFTRQTVKEGYTAIHIATMHKQIKSINFILQFVFEKKQKLMHKLLEKKSIKGYTALHLATVEGELDLLQILVKYGANLNAVTTKKWTCLHFANQIGNTEIVEYLLSLESS